MAVVCLCERLYFCVSVSVRLSVSVWLVFYGFAYMLLLIAQCCRSFLSAVTCRLPHQCWLLGQISAGV